MTFLERQTYKQVIKKLCRKKIVTKHSALHVVKLKLSCKKSMQILRVRRFLYHWGISLSIQSSFRICYTSEEGDNGSNINFLGVSDYGYWLKGNVQEFSSFCMSLGISA